MQQPLFDDDRRREKNKKGRTVRALHMCCIATPVWNDPGTPTIVPVCPCFFFFLFCYVCWKYSAVEFETCRRYQVDWLTWHVAEVAEGVAEGVTEVVV